MSAKRFGIMVGAAALAIVAVGWFAPLRTLTGPGA